MLHIKACTSGPRQGWEKLKGNDGLLDIVGDEWATNQYRADQGVMRCAACSMHV